MYKLVPCGNVIQCIHILRRVFFIAITVRTSDLKIMNNLDESGLHFATRNMAHMLKQII
jgi:hypothetical protein